MNKFMNRQGKSASELDIVKENLWYILSTIKGTREIRRDFGIDPFKFTGKPLSSNLILSLTSEIESQLRKYERRFSLETVSINSADPKSGKLSLAVKGKYKGENLEVVA